jgi:YggT family protein
MFLYLLLDAFNWGLLIYCILSFIRMPQTVKIYDFLGNIYRPILDPISKLLYPLQRNIGLDFSPIVLLLLVDFIKDNFPRI